MCGIGGISSERALSERLRASTNAMFKLLTSRGRQAWGYWDGDTIRKKPGNYMQSKESDKFLDHTVGSKNILLHTRRVSKGSPKINKNNHPWKLGRFVLAHNGHFFEYEEIDESKLPKRLHGIETDSFRLLYWIWEEFKSVSSVPEAIVQGLEHVSGGYACWLHDTKTEITYLFRNPYPVFTFYYAEEPTYTAFASTRLILNAAFRNVQPIYGKSGQIYAIESGKLWVEREYTVKPIPAWRKAQLRVLFPSSVFKARLAKIRASEGILRSY